VESNRNFANKLWNAGRFVISAINSQQAAVKLGDYTLADSWIWAKLQQLVRDVERQFQNFQYGQAGQQIYDFIWNDFADWYVEIAKKELADGGPRAARAADTLARVFDMSLRLLHPFTPFVTEELWDHLRNVLQESPLKEIAKDWPAALIVARWPEPRDPEGWEEQKIADFALVIQDPVRAIRNFHAENNIKPSLRHGVTYVTENRTSLFIDNLPIISALSSTDLEQSFVYEQYKPSEAVVSFVVGSTEIYPNLAGMEISEENKSRLEKELKEAESHIQRLEKLLAGDFASKAPAALVQKERDKLAGYQETAEKIRAQLK